MSHANFSKLFWPQLHASIWWFDWLISSSWCDWLISSSRQRIIKLVPNKGWSRVVPNQSLSRSRGMMQIYQIFLFSIFICGNICCRMFQNKYTSSWWECLKLAIHFQDISAWPAPLGLFSQQYLSRPLKHFSDVRYSSSLMDFFRRLWWEKAGNLAATAGINLLLGH